MSTPVKGSVEEGAGWIAACGPKSITTLVGAGISTDSGILDYRGPQGVWTRNPAAQRMVHLDTYRSDPDVRRRAWLSRRAHGAWAARRTPATRPWSASSAPAAWWRC